MRSASVSGVVCLLSFAAAVGWPASAAGSAVGDGGKAVQPSQDRPSYTLRLKVKPGDVLRYGISRKAATGVDWKPKALSVASVGTLERTVLPCSVARESGCEVLSLVSLTDEHEVSGEPSVPEVLCPRSRAESADSKQQPEAEKPGEPGRYTGLSVMDLDMQCRLLAYPGRDSMPKLDPGTDPAMGLMWCRLPDGPVSVGDTWQYVIEAPAEMKAESKLLGTELICRVHCFVIETTAQSVDPSRQGKVTERVWLSPVSCVPLKTHAVWTIGKVITCETWTAMSSKAALDDVQLADRRRQALLVRYMLLEIEAAHNTRLGPPADRVRAARRVAGLISEEFGTSGWANAVRSFDAHFLKWLESDTKKWPVSRAEPEEKESEK